MMPNVVRGDRPVGLMMYLVGGGRSNEHTEPHLVAGDPTVTAWLGDDMLDREAALQIGRDIEQPARIHGVEIPAGLVWHCSLSLHEREGLLSDEQWSKIAHELVDEMGFSHREQDGEVLRSGCRWVAVRHGVSTGGNDHVHLVVGLVREDGSKANVWRDMPRVQKVCGELEVKYGLEVLDSRQQERGGRASTGAEIAIAEREGRAEPAAASLARTVRVSAAQAASEAEFVRLLRGEQLWVRPRFAAGRSDVVAGYSVALRPGGRGAQPVWYGGGRLGKDLSLPQLRKGWESTPQSASEAVAEWQAAMGRDGSAVETQRPTEFANPALIAQADRELTLMCEQLRDVPLEDASSWAHVARDAAGLFAAWSARVEPRPGPLARASDVLARSAQVRPGVMQRRPAGMSTSRTAARALRYAQTGGHGASAEALLWRQIAATMSAVYEMHQARGDAQTAANIARMVRDELRPIEHQLVGPAAAPTQQPAKQPPSAPDLGPGHGFGERRDFGTHGTDRSNEPGHGR